MLPVPGAVAAGAAGRAVMKVRAAARAHIILGLAIAAMALVAATTSPGDLFRAQSPRPRSSSTRAPAPGAQQCAATEADAQYLRATAMYLLFTGMAQVVVAVAADVAAVGSLCVVDGWLAVAAHLVGYMNALLLCHVVDAAAVVANGHCAGQYHADFVVGYVVFGVSYAALLGVRIAVTCY